MLSVGAGKEEEQTQGSIAAFLEARAAPAADFPFGDSKQIDQAGQLNREACELTFFAAGFGDSAALAGQPS